MVEITHKLGTWGDVATGDEVESAALAILKSCVLETGTHDGGLVRDLGKLL